MQKALDEINERELARKRAGMDLDLSADKQRLELAIQDLDARKAAWVAKAQAITPKLVEALQAFGDKEAASRIAQALGPMTLLGGGSAVEILNGVLKGTSLGKVFSKDNNGTPLLPDGGDTPIASETQRKDTRARKRS
jgi:major vault protein